MATPRVSIIVPVKAKVVQDIQWLEEALKSIAAQTYKDWEAIICNDRSPASLRPLAGYFRQPKFRGTKSKRIGVTNSRNQAASVATGDLLLAVDHDDLLPPNALELLVTAWDKDGSKAGIVYGNTVLFGQDFERHYQSPAYTFKGLLSNLMMPIGSLHQRADWKRVGGWKPEMEQGLEDWEYWIALGELGVCGHHVNQVTYKYRRHPSSRLAVMKDTPDAYKTQYHKMREIHRDTYNGRRPVNCCGGQLPAHARAQAQARGRAPRPQQLRQPLAALRSNGLAQVIYTGGMAGSFGIVGAVSGHRYSVPGPGRRLKLPDGREGVDPRDVPIMMRLNRGRDFELEA